MTRHGHRSAVAVVAAGAVGATLLASPQQRAASAPGLSFAVASIKRSVPLEVSGSRTVRGGFIQPGTRWLATNVPLLTILRVAYGAYGGMPGQVVGYPPWVAEDDYDVDARTDTDVTREQMQEMVRNLLRDRFKLVARTEQRELQGYVLTMARADSRLGRGLLPATTACFPSAAAPVEQPVVQRPGWRAACDRRISRRDADMGLWASNSSLANLAAMLQNLVEQPVLDRTGVAGSFDIEMMFSPEGMLGVPSTKDTNAPSLFTALEEQLGLKLERQRVSMEVLVIEGVERPSEN